MTADLGDHTITVINPAGKDWQGDPLPDGDDEFDVEGCYFQPGPSTEQTDQRDTVISGDTVFTPPGVDIRPISRVRFRGDLYQVNGKPKPWDDDDGVAHHIEVPLRRVEG